MPDRNVVIVGGGPAGWSCALALRDREFHGPVTLICEESQLPYDRTLVSKDCLLRAPSEDELLLSPAGAYSEAGVNVRLGVAAVKLDVRQRHVALSDGNQLSYDAIVLAVGGRPRTQPSLTSPGVHTLRTLGDARRLAEALVDSGRLVIVGGGFIAGEAASAGCARGAEVVMLEALDAPLAPVVGAEIGAHVAELHRRAGVEVRVRSPVAAVRRRRSSYFVELRGGDVIEADVVLVAIGSRPAVDWLAGTAGLRLDDGIVTDDRCRTAVPSVLAVGDCARWTNGRTGLPTRVEHWETAIEHGAAAAAIIAGGTDPFLPIPFVWSIQHGARLQWVGDATGWDNVETSGTARPNGLVARYFRGGELCAGFAIDDPRAVASIRRELADLRRQGRRENPRR